MKVLFLDMMEQWFDAAVIFCAFSWTKTLTRLELFVAQNGIILLHVFFSHWATKHPLLHFFMSSLTFFSLTIFSQTTVQQEIWLTVDDNNGGDDGDDEEEVIEREWVRERLQSKTKFLSHFLLIFRLLNRKIFSPHAQNFHSQYEVLLAFFRQQFSNFMH